MTLYRECAQAAADVRPGCMIDPFLIWRAAGDLGCNTPYDDSWDHMTYDTCVLLFLFADLVTRP